MNCFSVSHRGVILNVHVVPRSSRNVVQGLHGDAVKVRLQAPPVAGRANDALVSFMSDALDIPPRQITLLAGASGRKKRIVIEGLNETEIRFRLNL